jgi:cytochrome d ubiquinol oxidase subunit II
VPAVAAEHALGAVILVALVLYALSGGADYGGGMWDLLASGPRARQQRAAIEHAIGPVWEANHVWLILVIVVLFTAFPPAFAAIMTALHVPMSALLVGIVLRGAAFIFRKYDSDDDAVHRRWSTLFGAASFFTPFVLGLSLGALASGDIRVVDGHPAAGFFAGWTRPFAAACGLFALDLFAFLAATYLTVDVEAEPELQEDFRERALASELLLAPAALLTFLLARTGAPAIFTQLTTWWGPLLAAATSACALVALGALWRRQFRWARAAAIAQVTSILIGWGLAQFPHLIVPDVTLSNAATVASTQRALLTALAAGGVILFPAFAYLFHVFKRPAQPAGAARGAARARRVPALPAVVLGLAVVGLTILVVLIGWRAPRPAPAGCHGRIVVVQPPRGQPLECVCEAGTLSACFSPGP